MGKPSNRLPNSVKIACAEVFGVLAQEPSKDLFHAERSDYGQVVTDASLIDRTLIGAMRLVASVCGVTFEEGREGEDACLLVGKGSGVGEDVVKNGPLALIFVGAWLQLGCAVNEVMTACEEFELLGVSFCIEITHDEEVGVLSACTHGIGVCLQLLTDAHAQFLPFCTTSLGGQMNDIHIKGVAIGKGACHMQDVTCGLLLRLWLNALIFYRMEGEGRVE